MSYPGDWLEVRLGLTFDWNDQLRDDWQDFLAASSGQQVINALQRNTGGQRRVQLSEEIYLDSKEDIRMLSLS